MERSLFVLKNELSFNHSFNGGQAYRWQQTGTDSWLGVFAHRVWKLRREGDCIFFKVFGSTSTKETEDEESLLRQYFRLEEPFPLSSLYDEWAALDSTFAKAATKFEGVRMLQQDPLEMIFSFICSSNNSITRMKMMVAKMCELYGEQIATVDGVTHYDFPIVDQLADAKVQQVLEEAKFGYRAKFVQQAATKIIELGGTRWISRLRELPYKEAHAELLQLPGVGAKVADCICLTSLNHLEAIPVDVHVFRIASKYYLPHLRGAKSVTNRTYNDIGNHFRSLFGKYAGWPHCVLFCDDLAEAAFENMFETDDEKRTKRKNGVRGVRKKLKVPSNDKIS